jgi:predicted Zn-ribbon and HTH transcriptional regulator
LLLSESPPKATIEIHVTPITYRIEADNNSLQEDLHELLSFIKKNDDKISAEVEELMKIRKKAFSRRILKEPIDCRLPEWFYEAKLGDREAIALFLYFVDKPLTTAKLTEVINKEWKKIDLRNISKHLTSRGKSLYGYTAYDNDTQTYTLSAYGKKWVEEELIPTVKNQ